LGHSYGAYTTMVVCGMRPALNWLEPPVAPGKGIGPDLHDARVKCGVALSPQAPGEPFFLPESFVTLRVPLLGISGTKDKQQEAGLQPMNRYQAFDLWPKNHGQNIFVWLANAYHLDFADTTGSQRRSLPSPNRDDAQPIVRTATLLFFNAHLKADPAAAEKLTTDGLKPYLRGAVDSVEVRRK
jgi:predicted dienelactone hydrolase